MTRALVLTSLLFAALAVSARAQETHDAQTSGSPVPQKHGEIGSPTEEMLRRAEIKREEESHEEMVERSDEAAQIGEDILDSFNKHKTLTADDYKKLERLEKLARKIRGSAGGSDKVEVTEDPPGKIGAAVERLAELSGLLKKSVAKTSRLVVSAAVIKNSSDVIELIKRIRSIKQP
ncbi:MAG TPA: hypothetical protein VNZ44_14545 [Pyrinomonadaceae bacterium]|nr:hypothetical protein [Pyrinomonadaceae bacterium]